ncbi:MAG: hypothetical protein NC412_13280, partial [Roseburia sp.]|nr:hypothetical protein [Roseburia sp.]MCM1277528.1 hypothetical protein [Robinsoniella sp.]
WRFYKGSFRKHALWETCPAPVDCTVTGKFGKFKKRVDEKEKYAIIVLVYECAQKYTQSVVLLGGTEGRLGVSLCQM